MVHWYPGVQALWVALNSHQYGLSIPPLPFRNLFLSQASYSEMHEQGRGQLGVLIKTNKSREKEHVLTSAPELHNQSWLNPVDSLRSQVYVG